MSLRELVTTAVHNATCRPGNVPQANWGCSGCGAPTMDAYLTVGCDYCQAPGEGFCWSCIDAPNWPEAFSMHELTVLPGHERKPL
jgi:hypothetical protein